VTRSKIGDNGNIDTGVILNLKDESCQIAPGIHYSSAGDDTATIENWSNDLIYIFGQYLYTYSYPALPSSSIAFSGIGIKKLQFDDSSVVDLTAIEPAFVFPEDLPQDMRTYLTIDFVDLL
jgi:hypothetical protein